MNQGENAPPMHARCRCTIVAYLDGGGNGQRVAGRERLPEGVTYKQWRARYVDGLPTATANGKVSGALNPNSERAEEHAFRYYDLVRSMKTDCKRISVNTGFREEDIRRIKSHVFYKEHELYDGERSRFYPSYHMAQSWQRLIDGRNIQSCDVTLLNHEFFESVMESGGLNAQKAHELAEAVYNYSKLIK